MDPKTVVTLLALNLIAVGGLLHLISRRTADRAGLRGFATGSFVFGMSYLLRLVFGFSSGSAWGIVSDVGMVFATLAFATGLQQFSGRPPFGRRRVVGAVAACAGVALAANLAWPDVGRHAALNLALATAYGLMALLAATGAQREAPPLRPPLRLLALLIGLLAVLTVVRGLAVGDVGLAPLFVGPWAQAYYGYSIVVTMLLGPNLLWMVFVRLNQRLTELATHNPLTRLLNRNGLEEAAQRFFAARPPQAVMVLLLVDVDHFKRINDSHGHSAGDALLRGVAQTLAAQLRAGDLVARWGGEECLVACACPDLVWAHDMADRLRRAVEAEQHVRPEGPPLTCTVSIGVSAPIVGRAGWEAALRGADEALYAAKRAGRNRVQLPLSMPEPLPA